MKDRLVNQKRCLERGGSDLTLPVGRTHALLSTATLATLFNLPLAIVAGWLLWRSLDPKARPVSLTS